MSTLCVTLFLVVFPLSLFLALLLFLAIFLLFSFFTYLEDLDEAKSESDSYVIFFFFFFFFLTSADFNFCSNSNFKIRWTCISFSFLI